MLQTKVTGLLPLRRQLQALSLSRFEERQINRAMARKVASASKQRIRQQRDLSGKRWKGRQSGKGKMLKGISKRMKVYAQSHQAEITWRGGKVAYKHQHGWRERMTAKQLAQRNPRRDERSNRGMATRSQARQLLKLGYVIPEPQEDAGRRPTQKWIMATLTFEQAGFLIQLLENKPKKSSWQINLPKRSFLGANHKDRAVLLETLSDQIQHQMARRR